MNSKCRKCGSGSPYIVCKCGWNKQENKYQGDIFTSEFYLGCIVTFIILTLLVKIFGV